MPYLKKHLGQHHLKQGHLCGPLIDFLAPRDRTVIEVGPGGGVLTDQLLAAGARVIAIELDTSWAIEMMQRLADREFDLVVGDALELRWSGVPAGTLAAGNLPFGVSTRVIDCVLSQPSRIPKAGFMVQKEVADRLRAGPGDKAYGALSVLTSARSTVTFLGRVMPGSFEPPPKVEGAYVGFEIKEPEVGATPWSQFALTVHLAFSQRRKQLRNVLASRWGRDLTDEVLERARVTPSSRAEELEIADFVGIFRRYQDIGRLGSHAGTSTSRC
jgi:16S rRNA (adenine1518-N6/adenine1519-N6)-dimethyltransferase